VVDGLLHPEAAAFRYHRLEEGNQSTQLPGTDVAIVGVGATCAAGRAPSNNNWKKKKKQEPLSFNRFALLGRRCGPLRDVPLLTLALGPSR
jgi:hypothetical protein